MLPVHTASQVKANHGRFVQTCANKYFSNTSYPLCPSVEYIRRYRLARCSSQVKISPQVMAVRAAQLTNTLSWERTFVRPPSVVYTFKLEYLWSQSANLDQILSVASLRWVKDCIWFWGRLDQNSGFHGKESPHWLVMGKTMSPPFFDYFLSDHFYTCR